MHNEMYSENLNRDEENLTEEEKARAILINSDFTEAYSQLKEKDLLTQQTERVKEAYIESLESADFMTEQDWELLTVIDLYSPKLTVHCIETYQLAHTKIEHLYIGSDTLAELITSERVSLDMFYRACLLHDIGKTFIPESVLNHVDTDKDWLAISETVPTDPSKKEILERIGLPDKDDIEGSEIVRHMTDEHIPIIMTIPIRMIISKGELKELERRGISGNQPLKEVIKLHEPASQQILESVGLHTEARIAGQHHNYRNEKLHFPISSQSLGVFADLADILHLADVQEALSSSNRSYKKAFTPIKILNILVSDAERGDVNKTLTALWAQDNLDENPITPESDEDTEIMEHIRSFIQQHYPETSETQMAA